MKFRYQNPTALYFGEDYLTERLATEVLSDGKEILLVYGQSSLKDSRLYTVVMDLLSKSNVIVHELSGVRPNAYINLVRRGVEICRQRGRIALVLAVGGGSTIDTAKAIAAGAIHDGDVWDFFNGNRLIEGALPIGTVLTTIGTGSEMNPFSVISNEQRKEKKMVASIHLYPRFSICVPSATMTLPVPQITFGIVDMFTHVLETYLTLPPDLIVQKRLDEALLQTIVEFGSQVIQNPNDIHIRETLMYCSTLALNGMTSMGTAGDWSTHSIVDEIAGFYDVPHGALLATVLPTWLEYVQECFTDSLSKLGTTVFSTTKVDSQRVEAQECIGAVRRFFRDLGAPVSLRELGITDSFFKTIAERVTQHGAIGKIRRLHESDILTILHASL